LDDGDFVVEGRKFKAISIGKSYDNFKEAYRIFNKLLSDIRPPELDSRLFEVEVAVVFFVLGTIVTLLITFFFKH